MSGSSEQGIKLATEHVALHGRQLSTFPAGRLTPMPTAAPPLVAVVMGSSSDWPTMHKAVEVLERFGVAHEAAGS